MLAVIVTLGTRALRDKVVCTDMALFQLNLPFGHIFRCTACPGGFRGPEYSVAFDSYAVGLFDGAQPGRDPGLAGGDGLTVAPTVGAFGQVLAGPLDFADMGLSLGGVGGDGDVGGGVVQDEADRLGLRVRAG